MRQWWSKVAHALGRRQKLASELQQEMDAHLQFLIDENLERGMPPEEARAAARRYFGNATMVRERSYQSWQFPTFESLLQDLRYATRGIWRARAFSLIVILTLAVGIGANTAIFSAVYAVLLKPLPFPAGERLVWLGESSAKATGTRAIRSGGTLAPPDLAAVSRSIAQSWRLRKAYQRPSVASASASRGSRRRVSWALETRGIRRRYSRPRAKDHSRIV